MCVCVAYRKQLKQFLPSSILNKKKSFGGQEPNSAASTPSGTPAGTPQSTPQTTPANASEQQTQSQETPQRPKAALLKPTNMTDEEFLYGSVTDSQSSNNSPNRRVSIESPHAAGDSIEITVPGAGADTIQDQGSDAHRRVVKTSGPMEEDSHSQVWLLLTEWSRWKAKSELLYCHLGTEGS